MASKVILPDVAEVILPDVAEIIPASVAEIISPDVAELILPDVAEIILPDVAEIILPDVAEFILPDLPKIILPNVEEIIPPGVAEIILPDVAEIILPNVEEIIPPGVAEIILPDVAELILPNLPEIILPNVEEIIRPGVAEIILPNVEEIIPSGVAEIILPNVEEIIPPGVAEIILPNVEEIILPDVAEMILPDVAEIIPPDVADVILPKVTEVILPEATEVEKVVAEEKKMDILGSLPIEMFHEVLMYLSPSDLYNARNCCKNWRNSMLSFWQKKCKMECYYESEDDLNSEFYRNFVKQFSHWEGIYMYNSKLEDNWVKQNYKEVIVSKVGKYLCDFQYFCGDTLVVTLYNKILVIDSTTGDKQRFSLPIKMSRLLEILAAQTAGDRLTVVYQYVIPSFEREPYSLKFGYVILVNVWNIKTNTLLASLELTSLSSANQVVIHNDLVLVITKFFPLTLYIYNVRKEKFEYERRGIHSVCCYEDKIAIGNDDATVIIMDQDYNELMALDCRARGQSIDFMKMKGKYLVALFLTGEECDYEACVWNIETQTNLYNIKQITQMDLIIYLNEKKLVYVSGDDEKGFSLKDCHLDTGECILKLDYRQVSASNYFIVEGDVNDRNAIKMWSVRTGKLITDLHLPAPPCFDSEFFFDTVGITKTKSKFVYFDCDIAAKPFYIYLRIIDFQAPIEM